VARKSKEKRNKRDVLLILIIFLGIILLALIYLSFSVSVEKDELEIYLNVGNYTGVDLNTSALTFGTLAKSASASRNILITNENKKSMLVIISVDGQVKEWIDISEKIFVLNADEIKAVKVIAEIPQNAEFGGYNGTIIVKSISWQ